MMYSRKFFFALRILALYLIYTCTSWSFSRQIRPSSKNVFKFQAVGKSKVCIIGGGFGGLYTALDIASRNSSDVEITLIDSKDEFLFSPLLCELTVGTASEPEVAPLYSTLLQGSNIKFIKATVQSVDFKSRLIHVDSDVTPLEFDQCVIAVGNQPRLDLINGAREHAIPFYRKEDAVALKSRIKELQQSSESPKVVVIGGGYSGVEVATNIAKVIGLNSATVTIVDRNSKILQSSPEHNRDTSTRSLVMSGVDVRINTAVVGIEPHQVKVENRLSGQESIIEANLVILTSGVENTKLLEGLDLPKDESGRLLTAKTLQCKGHPNVFALGDCCTVDSVDSSLPRTAQVAMQQSNLVARNILTRVDLYAYSGVDGDSDTVTEDSAAKAIPNSEIHTKASSPNELAEFVYLPLGEMLTLGPVDATVSSLGGFVELEGPLAAAARRLVYVVRMPTNRQRATAALSAGIIASGKLASALLKLIPRTASRQSNSDL